MSAAIVALRPAFATPPRPYRFMTATEAVLLNRGNVIELWDGRNIFAAFIQSFTEDAVNVTIVSPYTYAGPTNVALEIFNADLEDGPTYPPRTRDLQLVALRLDLPSFRNGL